MRLFIEGMGRCGTSLVYLACVAAARQTTGRGFFRHFREVPPEPGVYKTHDYPPHDYNAEDKFVYLVGNPERIVRSVIHTDRFFKEEHFRNFGREFRSDEDSLVNRDGLGLSEHFFAWKKAAAAMPVLFLHYEAIWENEAALRDFTGLDVRLPERQQPRNLPEVPLRVDFSNLQRSLPTGSAYC